MEEEEDTSCFANLILQRCRVCSFAADRKQDLISHVRDVHNNNGDYNDDVITADNFYSVRDGDYSYLMLSR